MRTWERSSYNASLMQPNCSLILQNQDVISRIPGARRAASVLWVIGEPSRRSCLLLASHALTLEAGGDSQNVSSHQNASRKSINFHGNRARPQMLMLTLLLDISGAQIAGRAGRQPCWAPCPSRG